MDSLIRLDVIMPITPITESRSNAERTAENDLNSNPEHIIEHNYAIMELEEAVSDCIDLTNSQGDGDLLSNHDMLTIPIHLTGTYPQVNLIGRESSGSNHYTIKHKLAPSNHSPSKVSRTDNYGSPFAVVVGQDSKTNNGQFDAGSENPLSFGLPSVNRERIGSVIVPPITKTHTVTSVYNRLQAEHSLGSNASQQNTNSNIPEQLLAIREPNSFRNERPVYPQPFHRDIMEERDFQTKLMQQNFSQTSNNLNVKECNGKESPMFYQLLDMFPDIDLKFLESQCRLGLDINQVSEIILEMSDYPKYNFQPTELRTLTPKEVNTNLNYRPNFNVPPSGFTSTTYTIAEDEVQLFPEEKQSVPDNFPSVAHAPTSTLVSNCNSSTTQMSGKEKETIISIPETRNCIKTSTEAEVMKNEPVVLFNEENKNPEEKRKDSNSVHSERQFSFLMEIFPDADPTFMEMKSKLKNTDLRNFIAETMEKQDYPKVTKVISVKKESQDEPVEIGLYTSNFVLENFIKIFPDPFGYFLDENRNCQYSTHGIEFLKRSASMDSLIRLDVIMPITPITESRSNAERTAENDLNSNPEQFIEHNYATMELEEAVSDCIDLTNSQGDGDLLSNHDMSTIPIPLTGTYPQVNLIGRESSGSNHYTIKHKLAPSNHSPSKVSRTDNYGSPFAVVVGQDSKTNNGQFDAGSENPLSFGLPSVNRERIGSVIVPPITKTHTVTSVDNRLQAEHSLGSNASQQNTNSNIPEQLLAIREPNSFRNERPVYPQPFHRDIMEERDFQTKLMQQNFSQTSNNLNVKECNGKESPMFYQLLDMFPDIDLKFLESQCRLGLDINQVSEIILEMSDYPKYNFQPTELRTLTPKEVNTNLNYRPNFNVPPSGSTSTTYTIAEDEVQLFPEEKQSVPDNFPSVAHAPTSTLVSNCNSSTTQMSGKEKETIISIPETRNCIKTSTEAEVMKNEPVVLFNEENKNPEEKRKDSNSVHSERQFSFLMEIFPDADPTFMEMKSKLKNTDLRNFIAETMEKQDYPKVTKVISVKKESQDEPVEIGLYTSNFVLENFIKIFPDPFGYFLDENRNCQYSTHGIEFLKRSASMDSLIRLDVIMPITPITESRSNAERTAENDLNSNPEQFIEHNYATMELEEAVSDCIDLTNSQGDGDLLSNHDMSTIPIPLTGTYPQVNLIGRESSGSNHYTIKHKLAPSNHSPSKVSRTDNYGSPFAVVVGQDSKTNNGQFDAGSENPLSFGLPSVNRERIGSVIVPPITKTHTVTSVDNRLQAEHSLGSNASQQNTNSNIPEQLLAIREPNSFRNERPVYPQPFHRDIMEERDFQTKLMQQNFSQTSNNLNVKECNGKESPMFYQLLDMFPDIDLKFLESQCRLGLDINQVSEIILEMSDYPKYNFQPTELRTLTPKEVNTNLNYRPNFNVPPSGSTSTTYTIAEDEVQLFPEEKQSVPDNFPSVAHAPTSTLVSNCNSSTTQMSGKEKETIISIPETRNCIKTSTEAEVMKNEPVVLFNEENKNPEEKRKDSNSVHSERQFSFLMEIFPDADPTFMEMKSKLKNTDLRNFIAETMEKQDYPKVTKVISVKKESQDEPVEIGLYTSNFVLENFIKIFPDPFGYFLDENRNCQYSTHGIEFLKRSASMDSLIRLDVIMPITPITESRSNAERTAENDLNSNPEQFIEHNYATMELEEAVSDCIDLTNSQGDGDLLSNHDMSTIPIPLTGTYPQVNLIGRESSGSNHYTIKHKLAPSNHSPSKVSRTDNYGSPFAVVVGQDSKTNNGQFDAGSENPLSFGLPSVNRERIGSVIVPPITKTHTVTSVDNRLQAEHSLGSNASQQNTNSNIPEQLLAIREPNSFRNERPVYPQPFHRDIMEERDFQTKLMQQNFSQTSNNLNVKECNGKESPMFYQLLDMFPDIDLKFLESQCRLGLDINQVSEIILEMSDYPKYNFQPTELRTLTPKEVNTNLNYRPNFNVPPSGSTSTTYTIAEDEVQLFPEEKQSVPDNFPSVAHAPTSTLVSNCNSSTTQMSGKEKETIISIPETRNCIKTSTEAEVMKNEPVVLFNEENKNPEEKRKDSNSVHSERQFSFLMEIFPDADPTFMEMKSKLKNTDLRNFIAETMEKQDYPKVTKVISVKKESQDEPVEIGLYTSNFVLENFIKIFPDPFGYFLDENRNCQYSTHGIEFLKRRYRCHSIKLISMKYRELKFNLVKTCEYLDVEKPSRQTKRGLGEIRMPEGTNLPFLQEACFIEHKTEIKNHFDAVAESKRLSFAEAEARGELIECGCCFQDVLFEDCTTCNEGHLFCKTCVRKSVEVRIGDSHTTFPCLQDCDSVFSLRLLETLVDATMFSRLLQRIQMDEVRAADIEGLEDCPFCDFAIILPPETSIFKCLNPECLRESCRKCHKLSHIPQRCEELESDDQARARKYIEDEMTRALVRQCYKCKKSFIKMDGCNKMTCVCGAKMCYICREPIVDYKHFNGPGGEEKKKCPLYSTEKLLHVDAVEAVAKKALEEVSSKNPELKLKHDPSKILPEASKAKTTLPPGVNEEAQRLIAMLRNLQQQNEQIAPYHQQFREAGAVWRPAQPPIPPQALNNQRANNPPQDIQNLRAAAGPNVEGRQNHR